MNSVFLQACRREKTPFTPVWLMRQAGRYMKNYRNLRKKTSFLELCKNETLAAEITVSAREKLKVDAAIIFSDILLVLEAMGLGLEYLKAGGPRIKNALKGPKNVKALREGNVSDSLSFVFGAIRKSRARLPKDVPLIGFAGAPFTLASYMIEGGSSKNFSKTKKLMVSDEFPWNTLMEKISRVTLEYLNSQIEAGADAVQLFDSWAGVLTASEYEKYVLPYSKKLIHALYQKVPVIHFGTCTGPFLEIFSKAGGDVIGVDHRISLQEAWKRIGPRKAIQGNLDPKILLLSLPEIKKHVKKILKEADGRPGHIFNLGHGVLPETSEKNVVALVEMVHEFSKK